jgi:hypothetical protein
MGEVKVTAGYVSYRRDHPTKEGISHRAIGRQGDTIEVDDHDEERLLRLGVVTDDLDFDPTAEPEGESDPALFDASEAGEDELVEYLQEHKPNAEATIALANGDPDTAQRLIDAEEAVATEEGGEPRKTVIEGLEKIADKE